MTDLEFNILDELYFVTGFSQLVDSCDLDEKLLIKALDELYKKGWIRILSSVDVDEDKDHVDLKNKYLDYYYLASKEGLFAHNSTE